MIKKVNIINEYHIFEGRRRFIFIAHLVLSRIFKLHSLVFLDRGAYKKDLL